MRLYGGEGQPEQPHSKTLSAHKVPITAPSLEETLHKLPAPLYPTVQLEAKQDNPHSLTHECKQNE